MRRRDIAVLIDRHVASRHAEATFDALDHALAHGHVDVAVREVPTTTINRSLLDGSVAGVVVGPGSPYDDPERVLAVIASARERGVPLVGT